MTIETAYTQAREQLKALRDPFFGVGRPEPLKFIGPDVWSRDYAGASLRLSRQQGVKADRVELLQSRYHY
jgi:toxin YoeB